MANLRSKNDRAVAAYITPIAQAVDPSVSIYPANYSLERAFPIIDVSTSQGSESPPFSGNHSLNVRVRIEYPAANQPGQSNPQSNRLALDSMVDAVFDAFHKSDNGCDYQATAALITAAGRALASSDPTNHADMADYTCIQFMGVEYVGGAEAEESSSFVEMIRFQMYACPLQIN